MSEDSRLPAVEVRDGYHEQPARREQLRRAVQPGGGLAEVLQRVPHDDRSPLATALLEPCQLACVHIRARGFPLESERLAAARAQCVEQNAISSADVEHGSRSSTAVDTARKSSARAPQ